MIGTLPRPGRGRIPANAFSVRWSGSIAVPGAGDYVFRNIPGSIVLHATGSIHSGFTSTTNRYWRRAAIQSSLPATTPFTMHFSDSAPHAIRVEYAHTAPMFGAGVHLRWQPDARVMRDQAVEVARQADVVVAFVGLSPSLEGEEMPVHLEGFSGGDRTKIDCLRYRRICCRQSPRRASRWWLC